jgi:hypothetical protein
MAKGAEKMKKIYVATMIVAVMVTVACSQNTLAALVTTLGTACSAAAGLAGDAAMAQTILADTAKASQQVLNWKSGTPTQDVEQALAIVEADLSAIPETAAVAPFIDLGIATIDGILTDITGQAPPQTASVKPGMAPRAIRHPRYSGKLPKSGTEFATAWNKLVDGNPQCAGLVLK